MLGSAENFGRIFMLQLPDIKTTQYLFKPAQFILPVTFYKFRPQYADFFKILDALDQPLKANRRPQPRINQKGISG